MANSRNKDGISRRDMFAIGGALGVGAIASPLLGQTAERAQGFVAPPAPIQGSGFYKFKVGETEISLLSDGTFNFDPVFPLFGENATKEAVEKALADEFITPPHVTAHVNALLIRTPNDVILVDSGCGNLMGPTVGRLATHLARAQVRPDQINTIILTHAHPDHFGGLLDANGNPRFPNAEAIIQKDEHAFWSAENPDLSKSGLPQEMRAGMIAGAQKVLKAIKFTQVAGEKEIRPGVSVVAAPGHTPGHMGLLVDGGGGNQFFYITDVIHHYAIQMPHPDYFVSYDTDRQQAVATRKKLLDRAATDKLLIAGAHLPFPAVGHVRKAGEGYQWVPVVWEW